MAPKRDYTKEQMAKAFEEVQRGEKVSVAASKYNVPRITLRNKVMGISPMDCSLGPPTVLSQEEEKLLVTWILFMAEHHFPITKDHLLDSVQKIIAEKQMDQCPFTNNRPGKKWYTSFLKRHPEVSERTAQNLTKAREEVTEEELNDWFKINKEYLDSKNLSTALNDPTRIFNCDESAFFLQPKAGRVLVRRGEKNIYSAAGDEKENLTVLITANAAGTLAPPMIVYPYERIPKHVGDKIPGHFAIGKSDSGWMTAKTFYEYVANVFNPWLDKNKITKPILLFVDGHRSHMTLHLSELCKDKGIEIIALYPNSTHLLQPMDVAVFRPLKGLWKHQVTTWKFENPGQRLNKENFAPNFEAAIQKMSTDVVKNGFRKSGLYPFGPEYVDMGKISSQNRTNIQVEKENLQITEKKNFIKILEKEIQEVYSSVKLNLFKQLFYLPRAEVENMLAPEDESLFVIWAKIKSCTAGAETIPGNTPVQPELLQDDSIPDANSAPLEESSLTQDYPQSPAGGPANISGNTSVGSRQPELLQEYSVPYNNLVPPKGSSSTQEYSNCSAETMANIPGTISAQCKLPEPWQEDSVSDVGSAPRKELSLSQEYPQCSAEGTANIPGNISSQPGQPELLQEDSVSNVGSTPLKEHLLIQLTQECPQPGARPPQATMSPSVQGTSNSDTSFTLFGNNHQSISVAQKHSSSVIPSEAPNSSHDFFTASTSNHNVMNSLVNSTPQKTSITSSSVIMPVGIEVPSPFKRALLWPEPDNKKRRTKEQLPSAITGEAWRAIMAKKEAEKKRKEEEKERRKQERQEKKNQREKMIEEKKKMKEKDKSKTQSKSKHKKKNQMSSSTDDSNSEIDYGESEYDVQDDLEEEEEDYEFNQRQLTALKENIKRGIRKRNVSESESEENNLPPKQLVKKKPKKESYVIINYEGEYFPGVVKNIDGKQYEISTMILSKGNSFRWPENPDQIWYNQEAIVENIGNPVLINKRGFYKVKEMEKYLTFVSL